MQQFQRSSREGELWAIFTGKKIGKCFWFCTGFHFTNHILTVESHDNPQPLPQALPTTAHT